MKPWEWLDQAGMEYKVCCKDKFGWDNGGHFMLTEAERAFIVAACRAFENRVICSRCGGLSWDVPLTDYCKCGQGYLPDRGQTA